MKLSVVVPIYKVEKFLRQCINSILEQTYSNLEIILVDDGSPDNCPAICDEYAERDSRVKVIHKPNGGLIAARKSGVAIATGDYVTFVDGDDWIAPDMYKKVANAIEQYSPDCVITQFYFAYEDRNAKSNYLLSKEIYNREEIENDIFPIMLYSGKWYQFGVFPNCWTKIFKKEVLEKHIYEVDDRIRLGEDIAFTYPCLMECESIAFIDEALYYYRQNPESMTASYDSRLPSIYLLPYETVLESSSHLNVDLSDQLPYYLLYLINFAIRNEALLDDKKSKVNCEFLNSILQVPFINKLNQVDLAKLPLHTKMLAIALKWKSSSLLIMYLLIMRLHLN